MRIDDKFYINHLGRHSPCGPFQLAECDLESLDEQPALVRGCLQADPIDGAPIGGGARRNESSELCNHATGLCSSGGPTAEAGMILAHVVRRPVDRPLQAMGDIALKHLVRGKPDGLAEALGFEELVHLRYGDCSVAEFPKILSASGPIFATLNIVAAEATEFNYV